MTPNPEAALRHGGWPAEDDDAQEARPCAAEPGSAEAPADAIAPAPGTPAPGARSPLDGIRVLDFGMFAAGPYAAMLLADLGASVTKVEPLEGDTMRPAAPRFLGLHRGKRGLALDLKSPHAAAIVDRLVEGADVLIHNLRPGVAERLGVGSERLRAINGRLVYCHSTAYGTTGPLAQLGGFDQMLQALCGLEVAQGGPGGSPAQVAGGPLDYANGLLSAAAILMALFERARSGEGQSVECPQLGAALFATPEMSLTELPGAPALLLDRERTGYATTHRLYPTADERWIFVCCPDEDARQRFAALLGGAEDAKALEARFRAAPAEEWQRRLEAAGLPSEIAGPAIGAATLDWPPLVETGRIVATHHARYGWMRQPGEFVRFSRARCSYPRATPMLGEHTREILDELGFTPAECSAFHAERVVAWPDGEDG
jgi:crotonobetainyl-CoA:carnitine CoA-transferase CaiB-like acyl-CoA transferase